MMIEITSILIDIHRYIVNFDTTHSMHGPLLHNVTRDRPTFVGQTSDGHTRAYTTLVYARERRQEFVHSQLRASAQLGGAASPRTSAAGPLQGRPKQAPARAQAPCIPAGETSSATLYGTAAATMISGTFS